MASITGYTGCVIEPIDALILFVLGTIVGSFLNALAFRYRTGRSMWGRSACLSCGTTLRAHHLVPILSYVGLLGKCASCSAKISPQYPLVEIAAGIIAVLAWVSAAGSPVAFTLVLGFFTLLLFIALYDMRHTIIPDAFVYAAALVALACASLGLSPSGSVAGALIAGVALGAPVALLWALSRGRLIGLGDAKLFFASGAFLGLSSGVAAFLLSFWIGALAGLFLIALGSFFRARNGVTMKSEVPFGPFIVLSTAIAYFGHIGLYDLLIFPAF